MAKTQSNKAGDLHVPRVVSFIVLLVIILLVGAVFFQVMAQFMVPLFLACVLLVVFQPLHRWLMSRIPRYPRIAALLTTILIVLVVLLPTLWLGWNATTELQKLIQPQAEDQSSLLQEQLNRLTPFLTEKYQQFTHRELNLNEWVEKATTLLGPWVLSGLQAVLGVLIGLIIMVVALYYFLADGPAMIRAIMRLSPLDEHYELELLARFAEISRSVVVATMLSAIAQGILAGIGYYFALPSAAPVFLLTAATMLLAIVPFIGAAGVWVPVCLVLLAAGGGEAEAAGANWPSVAVLAVYCAVIVSGIDNVIKPLVLHGQSNLHPLLALLSILGGVQVLGPVGILVGPMLVSFLQALLSMFQREVEQWGESGEHSADKLSDAAAALAESIEAAVGPEEAENKTQSSPRKGGKATKRKRR